MMNDQLSDFLTRIRNAGQARLLKVDTLNTKMNRAVADILVKEGYLKSVKEVTLDEKSYLRVYLRFDGGDLKKPVIQGLRRASRSGLRRYVRIDKMPRVMSGFGMAIISTSKGVLSQRDAHKAGVGGEYLCSVW
jgi:small subunit ribosomal protein S8